MKLITNFIFIILFMLLSANNLKAEEKIKNAEEKAKKKIKEAEENAKEKIREAEKQAKEEKEKVVKKLLEIGILSDEQIAEITETSLDFVKNMKKK